jgi:GH15 family glucan-1,4-alpha-glucosidase
MCIRDRNLDASVLLMPIVGFLPATDPRMKATIEAIDSQLGRNGLIRRWPEEEGGFILCSYWMAQCLALSGEFERAVERFDAITSYANDLGLLPEEIEPSTGAMLGNYPQAFSHIGLVNTAWLLTNKAPEVVHP